MQVRLERPQVAVLSTKHYVNLGGSEMVVYRATPADVESGVQVGDGSEALVACVGHVHRYASSCINMQTRP